MILSSIDSNEDSKNKAEGEKFNTPTSTQTSIPKTIIRSTSTPTTLTQISNDTKIIITQSSTSVPTSSIVSNSQPSNVLFVKQIKALPPSVTSSVSTNPTIAIVSQSSSDQQGSVIISTKPSNLLSILSNQQQNSGVQQQSIKTNDGKGELPLTDNTKTVTILKSNPMITNLLNSNSFKRSKSSDDVITTKEANDAIINKRLSFEVSNEIKKEPLDTPIIKESTPTIITTTPIMNIIKTEPSSAPQTPTTPKILNPPPPPKPDDSNVLLKQLLQNSGSNTPGNPPLTRTVPALMTTQRAPSLGVFSSLEAQLARPVIPPAPSKQVIVTTQPLVVSTISSLPATTTLSITTSEPMRTTTSSNITKVMPIHETSFVSQPSQIVSNPPQIATSISSHNLISSEKKPIVILNRNDIPQSVANLSSGCIVSI